MRFPWEEPKKKKENQVAKRETEVSRSIWEPFEPPLTDKDKAIAKGKYWLPDTVDCKPDIEVQKPRHRKSRFAQDFEDSEE